MKFTRFLSVFTKIFDFCKEKPEVLFVIVFQALLIASAVLSINGDSSLANDFAMGAYISLVMVVVLQLVLLLKRRKE